MMIDLNCRHHLFLVKNTTFDVRLKSIITNLSLIDLMINERIVI